MSERFRPFLWPALFVTLAAVLFTTKIRTEMVDFGVYRTAGARAISAEPLYRSDDGHYQFKYLPAFAMAMAPFARLDREAAQAIWFALSAGLLTAFVRWSVRGLPERRRSEPVLAGLAVLFMAKFYAHELTLGQTNIMLGCLLAAALLAVQIDQPVVAGALIGVAAFVKPYALILLPWLAFTYGLSAAISCALVLLLGLLLPIVRYGWTGNLQLLADWYRTVTESTTPNLTSADNVSLAAMWAKWLGPGGIAAGMTALSSLAAITLVGTVWLKRLRVSSPDYLEFALLMILIPLLSPQGWDYLLLLATPGRRLPDGPVARNGHSVARGVGTGARPDVVYAVRSDGTIALLALHGAIDHHGGCGRPGGGGGAASMEAACVSCEKHSRG